MFGLKIALYEEWNTFVGELYFEFACGIRLHDITHDASRFCAEALDHPKESLSFMAACGMDVPNEPSNSGMGFEWAPEYPASCHGETAKAEDLLLARHQLLRMVAT